jgi:Ca2+-binding RTX toxin-like protein
MTAVIHATATDSLNGLSSSTTQNLVITLDPYTTVTGAIGTGTDDKLVGTSGNEVLIGGGGNDLIIAGAGNHMMTGGAGSDVFRWGLNDHGTTTTPAQDTITDWSTALPKNGGDVLDLRDLLVGESHGTNAASGLEGNLTNYIHFEHSGADTIVDISTAGQHTAGSPALGTDLKFVLSGVDLTNGGTTTDAAIIQDLLKNGKLHTD